MRMAAGRGVYFVDKHGWFWWYNGDRWVGLPMDLALDQGVPQRISRLQKSGAPGSKPSTPPKGTEASDD